MNPVLSRLSVSLPSFSYGQARPLGAWLAAAVLLNILLCTTGGYSGDIGYWVDWTTQLQRSGYENLNANYPPLYIHWLWLIGKFEAALQIPLGTDALLRFLVNTPILIAHGLLLLLLDRLMSSTEGVTDTNWNVLIGFTALHPALLMNGPIWGQVDLLYGLIITLALALLIEGRALLCVFPLLAVAILTKFQSVCIAPVLLPLFWHRRCRALWLGLIPAALLAALLLLPYWLAGSAGHMFEQTYIKTASLYPYASYHANNLWYLLGLNTRPDNVFIFNYLIPTDTWQKFFTAKPLGMMLCSLWGVWLTISSWRNDDKALHWRNAFLAALGFFLFLPAMHERYLMPAVVISLAAAARHPRFLPHAVILSMLCACNMIFVLHPTGGLLSYLFSGLTVLFALVALTSRKFLEPIARLRGLPFWCWALIVALIWLAALSTHLYRMTPDSSGWLLGTTLQPRSVTQDWGELRTNSSVNNGALSVNKRRYEKGYGTHAASTITLNIPADARSFTALVGVDDESSTGEVEFRVRVDGRSMWQSGVVKSGEDARRVTVDVKGAHTLELIVDPLGANTGDHADWLEPGFHTR